MFLFLIFSGEVLSKLPVVQHVLFGSILQCTWSESALNTNHNNNNTNNNNNTDNADNKSNSTSTQLSSVTVFNTNNMINNNNSNSDNNHNSNSESNSGSGSRIENNNDRKIGSKTESTETKEDNKLLSLSAQALTSLDDDL